MNLGLSIIERILSHWKRLLRLQIIRLNISRSILRGVYLRSSHWEDMRRICLCLRKCLWLLDNKNWWALERKRPKTLTVMRNPKKLTHNSNSLSRKRRILTKSKLKRRKSLKTTRRKIKTYIMSKLCYKERLICFNRKRALPQRVVINRLVG